MTKIIRPFFLRSENELRRAGLLLLPVRLLAGLVLARLVLVHAVVGVLVAVVPFLGTVLLVVLLLLLHDDLGDPGRHQPGSEVAQSEESDDAACKKEQEECINRTKSEWFYTNLQALSDFVTTM